MNVTPDPDPSSDSEEGMLIKVLAIDGGGARGVIPAVVLDAIERRTGELLGRERVPAHELFDIIAGTSTGSLIAAMLTVPRSGSDEVATAAQIGDYYMGPAGKKFFHRTAEYAAEAKGMQIPAYPATSHVDGIQSAISTEAMLSQARTNLAVTIYDLADGPPRTYTFTRWKARYGRDGSPPADHDFPMWQVIRAASTFPGIWPGWRLESASGRSIHPLDGGMFAINPVMEGLAHSIRMLSNLGLAQPSGAFRFLIVSLGTGFYNVGIDPEGAQQWGAAQWFVGQGGPAPVVQVLFEGQADSANMLMRDIQSNIGRFRYYYRFQPEMEEDFQLDDVDPRSLETLRGYAEQTVCERSADLDRICELLKEGRTLRDVLQVG